MEKIEVKAYQIINFLKKRKLDGQKISQWLLAIGVGFLISIYIINFFRIKLIPMMTINEQSINTLFINLKIEDVAIYQYILFIVGIFCIICSFFFLSEKYKVKRIIFFMLLIFFDCIGVVSVLTQHKLDLWFVMVIIITSVYGVKIVMNIVSIIYNWLFIDSSNADRKVDIAKISLIWAIAATILGLA
ncbi:hypothetical protein [Agrilactobacillus composti]|uniref:hypothetical protein n=1 Tax=Agrilactobacillus composti TaxID=398555 RepID=UPI0005507A70|nr:hypothetical protein [Agrilactobacillus composti]